jgi:O-antigen/teichoic acid export membrane protein
MSFIKFTTTGSSILETTSVTSISADHRRRLFIDGVINNLPLAVASVVGIVLTPFMLRHLGAQSFGIWAATLAIISICSLLDLGVGWGLTRIVAARDSNAEPAIAAGLVFYMMFAVVIGGAIAVVGPSVSRIENVSSVLFPLIAIAFAGEQLSGASSAILMGQQRFRARAFVAGFAAVIRALCVIAAIKLGTGIVGVLVATAAVAVLCGLISMAVAADLRRLSIRDVAKGLSLLQGEARFCLLSRSNDVFSSAIWHGPLLLIGAVVGASSVAVYSVGQRFTSTWSTATWRFSEVFFPAASQLQQQNDYEKLGQALILSTRWMAIIGLPICSLFVIFAPELLLVWLGIIPAGATAVLRVSAIALMLGGLGNGAENLLWGQGKANAVVLSGVAASILNIVLGYVFLLHWGITGIAVSVAITLFSCSVYYLVLESRFRALPLVHVVREALRGLMFPFLVECSVMVALKFLFSDSALWALSIGGIGGLAVFALMLIGTNKPERSLLRSLLQTPTDSVPSELVAPR